jgi:hypothetical protein
MFNIATYPSTFPTDFFSSLTSAPSFCHKSRSNRKTQPSYWLATNNTSAKQNYTFPQNKLCSCSDRLLQLVMLHNWSTNGNVRYFIAIIAQE